jgi:hypothetical protein
MVIAGPGIRNLCDVTTRRFTYHDKGYLEDKGFLIWDPWVVPAGLKGSGEWQCRQPPSTR